MTVVELPIDHDEWQRIRDVSYAAGIDDLVNPPVLVHTHPGSGEAPHWLVWSQDGTVVEVRHDLPANRPLKVALPGKAIFHGMHLAAREGSCTLVLNGSYALLVGGQGSEAVFDLPPTPPEIGIPHAIQPSASATARGGQVADAILGAATLPEGMEPGPGPAMEVGIEADAVGFGVDWRCAGRPRCTFRAPADTQGTAVVGFQFGTVKDLLLHASEQQEEVIVTAYLDCVGFETERWKAWADKVDTTAARLVPLAAEVLEEAGLDVEYSSGSSLEVGGDIPVRVECFDGEPEVIRISTILATNLKVDAALRDQVDKLMASRVGLRLWFEGTRLVAAEDLPSEMGPELPATIQRFRHQLHGLDVLFAATGGTFEEPELE